MIAAEGAGLGASYKILCHLKLEQKNPQGSLVVGNVIYRIF